MTNNVLDRNVKTQQQQQTQKDKGPCQSRELNPDAVAPQSNVLPLDHHDN